MREFIAIISPQWWTFKNRLVRSDWAAYAKALFIVIIAAGFWAVALHYLTIILTRLQGMEGNVGNIIALKGLSLLLMLVFFLLLFSSLLTGLNCLYLSHDLPVILSSPVSWNNIYVAKWLETVIKSSWMIIFAILPVFVAFGLYFKASLYYFMILLPVLMMFVCIPAGLGIMAGIFLMAVVPARRAKNIFIVLGLLMLVIVMLLFRFLQPERFANPEWFANLTIFLSEMKLPVSAFLPSMWAAETLTPFFHAEGGTPLFYLLLLFFTAAAFVIFGNMLFNSLYYGGLVKAQQTHRPSLTLSGEMQSVAGLPYLYFRCLKMISTLFTGDRRAVLEKDFITFFRSVGQWSQMLLLFAIIIIYLFSIKALPVEWGTFLSVKIRYMISFFNIGIVGFIITSIASRIVLPQVNNEGPAFWIIRVSPMSIRKFLWSKFYFAFIPLLFISLSLIITSNLFLGVSAWFMLLGIGTSVVLVASITGLAVGIGAYSARFSAQETDKEQTGIHGTAFMLLSLIVIVATILLEIIPTGGMFLKEVSRATLTLKGWSITVLLFVAVLMLDSAILWLAMRSGEKRLNALE